MNLFLAIEMPRCIRASEHEMLENFNELLFICHA